MTKTTLTTSTALVATALLAFGANVAFAKKPTHRQVIDRYFEVVDGKQLDRLAEVYAADVVVVSPMGTMNGPTAHAKLLEGYATALPNYKHVMSRCVESGDTISCEGVFSGDHTGPMMLPGGKVLPPSKKHVELPCAGFATVKDGKIKRLHIYFDVMTFMQQIGAVPGPGPTASR